MKNLFIVRHGHADFTGDKDFERTLTQKGVDAVRSTAEFIINIVEKFSIMPQKCICSAATRTSQTAEIISQKCGVTDMQKELSLYSTHAGNWLQEIEQTPEQNLILVGHNPTMSQLIQNLSGYQAYMKPADCAVIALEIMQDGIIYPAKLIDYHSNE